MFPLQERAATRVLEWPDGLPFAVSLRHALVHNRPGLWGDDPFRPKSVLFVREGDEIEGWHAFGAGEAEPAVGWLATRVRRFSLMAPISWEGALRRRTTTIVRGVVESWVRPDDPADRPEIDVKSAATVRRLKRTDSKIFHEAAPHWGLRGWGSFTQMIRNGAAFGVPDREGKLAALAWIFEADNERDALAVATATRYRRLGLGRAAGAALVEFVEETRKKAPIWTVSDSNLASKALARSLGFSPRARETLIRWTP